MGVAANLAKKAAKAAGNKAKNKIVKTVNGGCPGADNGKHRYKAGNVGGHTVVYCRNPRCGRQSS